MLTEMDVHIMQQHFDAIEDAACAIRDYMEYRRSGRKGDAPESSDDVITRSVPVSEYGDKLWHRCLTLAYSIAVNRDWVMGHKSENLTTNQVLDIYAMANTGASDDQVATTFSVSTAVVSKIKRGVAWAHVTQVKRSRTRANSSLNAETAMAVYEDAWSGEYKYRDIAERYGISIGSVGDIKRGASWADVTGHRA